MWMSDQQRALAESRSALYKGNKLLFGWLFGLMFASLFISVLYIVFLIDDYPVPQSLIEQYTQNIPAGIALLAYDSNDPPVTEKQKEKALSIGALFYGIAFFFMLPLFTIWVAMLVRFVKKNTPFVIPKDSLFDKQRISRDSLKSFFAGFIFTFGSGYTFFFDYSNLLKEDYFFYATALFVFFLGASGMLFALANYVLLKTQSMGEK